MTDKPACYGSIVCFAPQSKSCVSCKLALSCYSQIKVDSVNLGDIVTSMKQNHSAFEQRHKLSGDVTIFKTSVSKIKNYQLSDDQKELLTRMNKKSGDIAIQLWSRGIDLKDSLKFGVIPFDNKWEYLKVACVLLIEEKSFTRDELRQAMSQFNWKKESVESYIRVVCSLLLCLQITKLKGTRYVLRELND